MEIVRSYHLNQTNNILQAVQRQAEGRFYHLTRTYLVQGKDHAYYEVKVAFLERVKKFFFEKFSGKDYFAGRSICFKDKKVTLLSADTAGLPVRPNEPISTDGKPASVTFCSSLLSSETKDSAVDVAPPSEDDALDDALTQRIISREFGDVIPGNSPTLSETKKTASLLFQYIEKNAPTSPSSPEGYERIVDLNDVRQVPEFQSLKSTELVLALNYLLLAQKIHFYQTARSVILVCLDQKFLPPSCDSCRGPLIDQTRLMNIDEYMAKRARTIEDLMPLSPKLMKDGKPDPQFVALLTEIQQFSYSDATEPQVHQVYTELFNKRPFLDFLLDKGVIKAWVEKGPNVEVSLCDLSEIKSVDAHEWRTRTELQKEAEFRKAHQLVIDERTLPSDWDDSTRDALRKCVRALNERGESEPLLYMFSSGYEGQQITEFLQSQKNIVSVQQSYGNPFFTIDVE